MNKLLATCLLSSICFLALPDAAAQRSTVTSSQGPLGDFELISCGQGSLYFLPGDYYFRAGYEAAQAGNTRKAVSMFESSASWGDKRAMFNLGLLLFRGQKLPKNEALGLAWLALSAERDKDQAQRRVLASAWQSVTQQTRDAATVLWNRMKAKYADRVTLPRAQEHYRRRTSNLRSTFLSDPVRIDGICGPKTVGEALQAMDEIASDSIMRPRTTLRGEVIVGDMKKVDDPSKEP